MTPPADDNTTAKALALLDRAATEPSDHAYAELVCAAADIASRLEHTSDKQALSIWQRIAHLDEDRARLYDLVDHARQRLKKTRLASPATFAYGYEEYLSSLPPTHRLMNQAKYCLRIVSSNESLGHKIEAAREGLRSVCEYERSNTLNTKQRLMKQAFQDLLNGVR